MEELWSKAQTTGKIIERSGTKFNSGQNKQLALQDAETRLQSGGGLLGNDGLSVSGIINQDNMSNGSVGTFGMPINTFLWRGALDTINFMPLNSADPIGGTILTDWYSSSNNENESHGLNLLDIVATCSNALLLYGKLFFSIPPTNNLSFIFVV